MTVLVKSVTSLKKTGGAKVALRSTYSVWLGYGQIVSFDSCRWKCLVQLVSVEVPRPTREDGRGHQGLGACESQFKKRAWCYR